MATRYQRGNQNL